MSTPASHNSIASTRDYQVGHDKGELSSHAQSASFTSDAMLTPISTSHMPKPMHPDPTPSDNPELFDPSTRHANTHYHPEAKLSKKKRAKKLGTGVAHHTGVAPHASSAHAGGRTFSEHDKAAHERAERRDAAVGSVEHEEYETDEDDEAEQEEQSDKQHHENRVTGTEHGLNPPATKPADKTADTADSDKTATDEADKDKEKDKAADDQSADNPSLVQRATNVLSTAQQRASTVASSVVNTAQSVPVLGTLLSKVGLGGAKTDDKADEGADAAGEKGAGSVADDNVQAKKEEEA